MNDVGRIPNHMEGRLLMQTLDASALEQQQPLYRAALPGFVEAGLISQSAADSILPLIGLPTEDVMALETPYDRALKAGIITPEQLIPMRQEITRMVHSAEARCSGTAAYVFDREVCLSEDAYSTENRNENVIKAIPGGNVVMEHVRIEKSGDTRNHIEGNFTGLNAAVLAEGGTIAISDSQIVSHAIGGNNVFSHGKDSYVKLSNVLLDAYGAASNRCIYVSFGGRVDAERCEIISRGSISSPVATDVGGGTIRLRGCVVKALGSHCAALYSTGRIEADSCVCVAPETEGMIIVGSNSISLRNSHVFSGQNQGVKFASELGESKGLFSMEGGSLTAAEGPLFHVELDAEIHLKNAAIAVPSGELLKLYQGFSPPGMEQPEPGQSLIRLTLEQQLLSGTMESDERHTLEVELRSGSLLTGAIHAPDSTVTLSRDSRWILTGDSTIGTLVSEDPTGSNVILNGFQLNVTC